MCKNNGPVGFGLGHFCGILAWEVVKQCHSSIGSGDAACGWQSCCMQALSEIALNQVSLQHGSQFGVQRSALCAL